LIGELTISEARARLPELVRYVTTRPDAVVRIENRRRGERVVLTSEGYLRWLEAMVKESNERDAEPFKLAGSIESDLTPDELEVALAEIEAEQAAQWEAELARTADEVGE
jgi:hypothetical protein